LLRYRSHLLGNNRSLLTFVNTQKKKSVASFCYIVNTVTQMNEEPDKASTENIPDTIALRTEEFAPLLAKWRSQNREVPWSRLLARGLRKELAPLAGKRYAHLVEGKP